MLALLSGKHGVYFAVVFLLVALCLACFVQCLKDDPIVIHAEDNSSGIIKQIRANDQATADRIVKRVKQLDTMKRFNFENNKTH